MLSCHPLVLLSTDIVRQISHTSPPLTTCSLSHRTNWWLSCLPLDGEAEHIFALPAKQLRMLAHNTPCIPTKTGVIAVLRAA